jgi:hypothetical protein
MPMLFAAILLLFSGQQQTQEPVGVGPEPAPTPISWELELKFVDPKRIEVLLPGQTKPTVYWYMLYTVTNPGDRTQLFVPTFQIVTEDLRVIDTDMGISPLVFDTIRELHKATHPYLVNPTRAIGELRTGDDNARESVAIWRDVELSANNFSIFVAGLSGETRFVKNPKFESKAAETRKVVGADGREREVRVNPRFFVLRKTLEIVYALPGSPDLRGESGPQRQAARWVMR